MTIMYKSGNFNFMKLSIFINKFIIVGALCFFFLPVNSEEKNIATNIILIFILACLILAMMEKVQRYLE